jgi:hypothetical protein
MAMISDDNNATTNRLQLSCHNQHSIDARPTAAKFFARCLPPPAENKTFVAHGGQLRPIDLRER